MMLVAPRRTIRGVVDEGGPSWALPLLALYGTAVGGWLAVWSTGDLEVGFMLVFMVALLPVISFLFMCLRLLEAAAFTVSGRLLGGVATYREIREALAWTSLPGALLGLLWVPIVWSELWGGSFKPDDWDWLFGSETFILAAAIPAGLAVLWGISLRYAALVELHRFRLWRALVSGLLALPPRVGALGIVVGIVYAVSLLFSEG